MAQYRVPVLEHFHFQPSVKDKDLTAPPVTPAPTKGDRYLVAGTGSGDWTGLDNHIQTYDGASWLDDTAAEGWMCWVEDENEYYKYDGASWSRYTIPTVLGEKGVCIAQVESDTDVAIADGKIAFTVPLSLDGMNLVDVIASVHTKGVTGTTDVQIRRRRAGAEADMLSTKITIGDEWFASDEVIDEANDDVEDGDQIYIDVDAIHSGTAPKGLSVVLTFRKP